MWTTLTGVNAVTEYIKPRDEAHWLEMRREDITSTEISALFGLSPYASAFEVWHRHAGLPVSDFEMNDRVIWGQRLQSAIAKGIAEDQGWQIRPMEEYARDPDLRMGSSFDFAILSEPSMKPMTPSGVMCGLLEVKNVDALVFKDGWVIGDDDVEAPPHIELQVQHQLALTGLPVCYVGALVGGNRVQMIKREPDVAVIASIRQKVKEFWKSIDDNVPPEPDFIKDSEFISKLYNQAAKGKVIDKTDDIEFAAIALEHKMLGEKIRELEAKRDACKAMMLVQIGDAEKVIGDGWNISAGVVEGAEISYVRKPYRAFRCTFRKVKE